MKKLLEKQAVFKFVLRFLAFFAQRKAFYHFAIWGTNLTARLNLLLNRPRPSSTVVELAESWQQLMPPDGQDLFPIQSITEDTAYTEIHLHCPLRGSGNVAACYRLMNYDRQLMAKVGGQLIVLDSQANSGKNYCRLAIRKQGDDTSDLVPAHQKTDPSQTET
ncbi:MAG: hypothetical protein AAF206_16500 [Bacteroidota bacterium]